MYFEKNSTGYILAKSEHQRLTENQNIYGVNRLEPRCTVIPSGKRDVYIKTDSALI